MNIHDKNHLSDIKDSWHQRDVRSGDSPISAWWYASIATFSEQFCFMLFPFSFLRELLVQDKSSTVAQLLFWLIFSSGHVVKPFGTFVYNLCGNQNNKMQSVLFLSPLLMGIATLCLGIIQIGPEVNYVLLIIITVLRIIQGIAASGNHPASAMFILHNAETEEQKSAATTFLALVSAAGTLMAAAVGNWTYSASLWRYPFIGGALISIIGAMIRWGLSSQVKFMANTEKYVSLPHIFSKLSMKTIGVVLALNLAAAGYPQTCNIWWKSYVLDQHILSALYAGNMVILGRGLTMLWKISAIRITNELGVQNALRTSLFLAIFSAPALFYLSSPDFVMIGQIVYALPIGLYSVLMFRYSNDMLKDRGLDPFEIAFVWHAINAIISPVISTLPTILFGYGGVLWVIFYTQIIMALAFCCI